MCRKFYKDILGCIEGRSDKDWVDFNFFGHQLVIHYQEKSGNLENVNQVDGKSVPIPHFGLVLEWDTFTNFAKNLKLKGIKFKRLSSILFDVSKSSGFLSNFSCFINLF